MLCEGYWKLDRFSKFIDKWIWLFLFLAVLLLCSLFPYTRDDFLWGSEWGIEMLHSGFRNYSGRYFGNTIVLLLTRSGVLRTLVMTGFLVGLDYMIVKISGCKWHLSLVIMALLFTSPKIMLRECIVWTSGFCNYTTSVTMFILYIYLITVVFSDQNLTGRRHVVGSALLLVLGYLSAMIVEHVTIMQIVLGLGIACWAWIKKGKSKLLYFFYPLGSVLGAATMFSNGCYAAVAAGEDFYRSVPANITDLFDRMCNQYFAIIGKQMILDSIILELFAAVIITMLCFQKIGEWKERRYVWGACVILIDFSALYGLLTRINTSWSEVRGSGNYIDGLVNAVFWLALLSFTVLIDVEERKKARMLISLFGIACANASLLFVTPIRSRCFFVSYVLLIWYCSECISLFTLKQEVNVMTAGISCLAAGLVFYMNLNIYGTVYSQNKQRIALIRQAEKENLEEVVVPKLKYGDYVNGYNGDETTELKAFYGISPELHIRYE